MLNLFYLIPISYLLRIVQGTTLTNIPFVLPLNKGIRLKDILDEAPNETRLLSESRLKWLLSEKGKGCVKRSMQVLTPKERIVLQQGVMRVGIVIT